MGGRARKVKVFAAGLAATALWAGTSAACAGKAHEHGVARLDIGVEAGLITLSLDVPLEGLVGFERAPRTDAERAAVTAALARLQEADKLVRIDSAAGCGAGKVELVAPVWGVGGASPAAAAAPSGSAPPAKPADGGVPAKDGHGDLEATYEFRCSNAPRANQVELGLFEAFARLKRIEVQAVMPRGQMKVVLRRPQTRVGLAR
ncbi:MAG: DUF2796 domain-containing protein [Burkholderiales bacterium]|nr:DUF2796 domain-containing protein [Burkholderiales bacterium]